MSELKDIQNKSKKKAWKRTSVFFILQLDKIEKSFYREIEIVTNTKPSFNLNRYVGKPHHARWHFSA
jgi:hypothetical protein